MHTRCFSTILGNVAESVAIGAHPTCGLGRVVALASVAKRVWAGVGLFVWRGLLGLWLG